MIAARKWGNYKLDSVGYMKSDEKMGAMNGQTIIHFSKDRRMRIII
jgi:hypothetical protein